MRREIEFMTLQQRAPQMFKSLLIVELSACSEARDLAGIQEVIERMKPPAARFSGWAPALLQAEACFHFVRGDLAAAKQKCEECLGLTDFDAQGNSVNAMMWQAAGVTLSEVLLAMEQAEPARQAALRVIQQIERFQPPLAWMVRALALAEAKLGVPGAVERLDALIARQNELGVTGLRLGATYEARARIAIWQRDAEAFERYSELTAREYRHGAGSALGARYERLLNEAQREGLHATAALEDFAYASSGESVQLNDDVRSTVLRSLTGTSDSAERARAALQLICALRQVEVGQLYLLGPGGLALAAVRGEAPALDQYDAMETLIEEAQARSLDMDDMSTDQVLDDDLGDAYYELLLLSCVVEGELKIAGVAAVERSERPFDATRQLQLLDTLATHLLGSADAPRSYDAPSSRRMRLAKQFARAMSTATAADRRLGASPRWPKRTMSPPIWSDP